MSSYWRAPRPLGGGGGGPASGRGACPALCEPRSHRADPPEAPPAPAATARLRATRFGLRGSRVSTSASSARLIVHLLPFGVGAAPAVGLHRPAQGQSVGVTLGGEGPARGGAGLAGVLEGLHPAASSPGGPGA